MCVSQTAGVTTSDDVIDAALPLMKGSLHNHSFAIAAIVSAPLGGRGRAIDGA